MCMYLSLAWIACVYNMFVYGNWLIFNKHSHISIKSFLIERQEIQREREGNVGMRERKRQRGGIKKGMDI